MLDDGILWVVNGGEPVSPQDLEQLPNHFVRSKTKVFDSGLGLAIVDAIITRVGFHPNLLFPARGPQDGFETELNLNTDLEGFK